MILVGYSYVLVGCLEFHQFFLLIASMHFFLRLRISYLKSYGGVSDGPFGSPGSTPEPHLLQERHYRYSGTPLSVAFLITSLIKHVNSTSGKKPIISLLLMSKKIF